MTVNTGIVSADTVRVTKQPVGRVYVIMVEPAPIPVTIPVASLTFATDNTLLLQVPPPDVLDSVIVDPLHTLAGPVIAAGNGFTVKSFVLLQPVGSV